MLFPSRFGFQCIFNCYTTVCIQIYITFLSLNTIWYYKYYLTVLQFPQRSFFFFMFLLWKFSSTKVEKIIYPLNLSNYQHFMTIISNSIVIMNSTVTNIFMHIVNNLDYLLRLKPTGRSIKWKKSTIFSNLFL